MLKMNDTKNSFLPLVIPVFGSEPIIAGGNHPSLFQSLPIKLGNFFLPWQFLDNLEELGTVIRVTGEKANAEAFPLLRQVRGKFDAYLAAKKV